MVPEKSPLHADIKDMKYYRFFCYKWEGSLTAFKNKFNAWDGVNIKIGLQNYIDNYN